MSRETIQLIQLSLASEALLFAIQILLFHHPRPQVGEDPNIDNSSTDTFLVSSKLEVKIPHCLRNISSCCVFRRGAAERRKSTQNTEGNIASPTTKCEMHSVKNVKYQMSNVKCQMQTSNANVKCQMSNVKSQRSKIKYQKSNIKYQISNIKYQISNIKYQISNMSNVKCKCQNSNINSQISNIKYPISKIKYQISNIKYQLSNIKY